MKELPLIVAKLIVNISYHLITQPKILYEMKKTVLQANINYIVCNTFQRLSRCLIAS